MSERSVIEKAVSMRSYEWLRGLEGRKYENMWVLFHRYVLNQEGQLYPVSGNGETDFYAKMSEAFSVAELKPILPDFHVGYSFRALPTAKDTCGHCGRRFEVLDGHEAILDRETTDKNSTDYVPIRSWWHKKCHAFEEKKGAVKRFTAACDEVFGVGNYLLNTIPNEYTTDDLEPWFLAETKNVTFKFGWRRHVINIDWSAWEGGPDGRTFAPFKDFDVTKDRAIIHAYGMEKFKSHLKALYECSLLTPEEALINGLAAKDVAEVTRALLASEVPHGYQKYWGPRIDTHLLKEALDLLETEGHNVVQYGLKDLLRKR